MALLSSPVIHLTEPSCVRVDYSLYGMILLQVIVKCPFQCDGDTDDDGLSDGDILCSLGNSESTENATRFAKIPIPKGLYSLTFLATLLHNSKADSATIHRVTLLNSNCSEIASSQLSFDGNSL